MEKGSLGQLFISFLRVGAFGYGGPLATMAYMREELVEKHKWVSVERFLAGVALVKVLPGPVSCLLSVFLGHEVAGLWGGVLAGLAYILPAFLLLLGLCLAENRFQSFFENPLMQEYLVGLSVVVLGAIVLTAYKMLKEVMLRRQDGQRHSVFVLAVLLASFALARYHVSEWLILLGGGVLAKGYLVFTDHSNQGTLRVDPLSVFMVFFLSAFTVFGTGYMVLPVLEKILVHQKGWLHMNDFIRSVTYGNLTPGPIVIASTYMGYKIGGFSAMAAATVGMFLPSFLIVLSLKPLLNRILGKKWVSEILLGILPAVVGSILATLFSFAVNINWTLSLAAVFIASFALQYFRISVVPIMLGLGFIYLLRVYQ